MIFVSPTLFFSALTWSIVDCDGGMIPVFLPDRRRQYHPVIFSFNYLLLFNLEFQIQAGSLSFIFRLAARPVAEKTV